MSSPTFYLIRHGEKPPKINGQDQDGLDAQGLQRAQRLVSFFGTDSPYNIGLILAEKMKDDGSRDRPLQTITPLYTSLRTANPAIKLNTSISRDDAAKVAKVAKDHTGPGNVLICWEHGQLTDIAKAIGVDPPPTYPGDQFGIVWTVEAPYTEVNTPWGSEDGTAAVNGTGGLGQ